jgi:hypothetical protein
MSLYLTKHHAMKAYWGVEVYSTHSTSALDRVEWSASHPGRFTLTESAPGTHWTGGWVDPRTYLDTVSKEKFSAPTGIRTSIIRSFSP